jgi:hypothetical protein
MISWLSLWAIFVGSEGVHSASDLLLILHERPAMTSGSLHGLDGLRHPSLGILAMVFDVS